MYVYVEVIFIALRFDVERIFMLRKGQVRIISLILITGIIIASVSGVMWWGLPMLEKSKVTSEIRQAVTVMETVKNAIDEVSSSGGSRVLNLDLQGDMIIEGASLERLPDGNVIVSLPADGINSVAYTVTTEGITSAMNQWVPLDGFSPISQELYTGNETNPVTLSGGVVCSFTNLCPSVDINCTDPSMDKNGAVAGTLLGNGYAVEYVGCGATDYVTLSGPEKSVVGFSGLNNAGVIVVKAVPIGDKFKTTFKLVYRELDDLHDESGAGYLTQITKKGNSVVKVAEGGSVRVTLVIAALDRFAPTGVFAEKTNGPLTVSPVTLSFGSS